MQRWMVLGLAAFGCAGDDTGSQGDKPADDTDVVVPTGPLTYNSAKLDVQLESTDVGGQRVDYYIPDDVKGLLWAFHGTNGNVSTVQFPEWMDMYNRLLPHGFGLVMISSQDRMAEEWDTKDRNPNSNPDWQYMLTVQDYLVDNTVLTEATPHVAMGFSGGANMAMLFAEFGDAEGWDVRASVGHNGGSAYSGSTTIPAMFVANENDETNANAQPPGAAEACSEVASTPCIYLDVEEVDLVTTRFAKAPQFSQEESAMVFDEVVAFGMVDADGVRLIDIADMETTFQQFENQADFLNKSWIDTVLRVVWATHRFSALHADAEAAWIGSLL